MNAAEARRYYRDHLLNGLDKIADVEVYDLLDETIAAFVLISKKTHVVWRETYVVEGDYLRYDSSKLLYP